MEKSTASKAFTIEVHLYLFAVSTIAKDYGQEIKSYERLIVRPDAQLNRVRFL
jgi:hypothetical protein